MNNCHKNITLHNIIKLYLKPHIAYYQTHKTMFSTSVFLLLNTIYFKRILNNYKYSRTRFDGFFFPIILLYNPTMITRPWQGFS